MKALHALQAKHPDKIKGWYKDFDGYWIDLQRGWQWQECHTVHEWRVRDAVAAFKWIEPCSCDDCKR
jgi:hypothetical protein